MNYLHHCNPPIIHRDLKSSNLLIDRNWTVKVCCCVLLIYLFESMYIILIFLSLLQVGDFGLSRLKHETYLTTKTGKGTVILAFCCLLVACIGHSILESLVCDANINSPYHFHCCSLNGWHLKFFAMSPQMRSMLFPFWVALLCILNYETQKANGLIVIGIYRSDIYSFGVILWELATEKIPWENLNSMQVLIYFH